MAKTLLGLDIGTQTIKAVQLSTDKTVTSLLAAGYIATPMVEFNSVREKDEQLLAGAVNQLARDMKVTSADTVLSLPSHKVITQVIQVPLMDEKELRSSIQWEAEQFIPLPLSKVKLDYSIIDQDRQTQKMNVLLVAAPITLIEKYMRITTLAGLTPAVIETEVIAATRSIAQSLPLLNNILLVMFGASTTEITILHNQTLVYTKSYPVGGNTFTRAIAQELGFENVQAEEYKKTYGLEEDKLEGKIAKILTPFFNSIFSEMEKTVVYFKERYPHEEIKSAVIYGSGAKLPGLIRAVTSFAGVDAQVSNPFINISVIPRILATLASDTPLYTVSVGLALRSFEYG